WSPRTVVQRGWLYRTSTSGRARSGSAASASWKTMSRVSGSRWVTTITATPGMRSGMTATNWQIATVTEVRTETPRVKTITLNLPRWTIHQPGQHYDVRLTAPDGYQAERSYSVASPPEQRGEIDLTVERLDDGEVSTYLDDVLVP